MKAASDYKFLGIDIGTTSLKAAVFDGEGKPVTAGKNLHAGDRVSIRFSDSTVDATVSGVRESE